MVLPRKQLRSNSVTRPVCNRSLRRLRKQCYFVLSCCGNISAKHCHVTVQEVPQASVPYHGCPGKRGPGDGHKRVCFALLLMALDQTPSLDLAVCLAWAPQGSVTPAKFIAIFHALTSATHCHENVQEVPQVYLTTGVLVSVGQGMAIRGYALRCS